METCKVIFYPSDKEVMVPVGTDLLSAASRAGVYIYNICGGEGVCGKCKIKVLDGKVRYESTRGLTDEEKKLGYVLACRTEIYGDVKVEVPPESRMEHPAILLEEIYTPAEIIEKPPLAPEERIFAHGPLASKHYFEISPPTLEDNASDLERLYREIRRIHPAPIMQMGIANVRKLGKVLRENDWKITVTLGKRNGTIEVVLVEPGDTTARNYGIALDIGTTTVVAYLVDLNTEEVLAARASYNRQVTFGEDVITRIVYSQEPGGLEGLHNAVVETINDLVSSAVKEAGISLNDVNCVVAAGNTTMTHILLMVPPDDIRKHPYVPTATFVPVIRAAEAEIKINPRGLLACLPSVASYVGGDISAGVLASGIDNFSTLSLLIDLGTNGEIVVGNKEWLACCACSAGPAFEGVGIKSGIRAMEGAIQRVRITKGYGVEYSTIGGGKPKGICGSGLVDTVGELLKAEIIDRQGKFREIKSKRLSFDKEANAREFVLAYAGDTATGKDIVITETDIQNLIRSKGAVYMGAHVLLKHMGLKFENLAHVFVAGGLGTYLDIEKAIMMGLLPDLPLEKFSFIGNSSVAGAKMCLVSYEAMERVARIAKKMTYFELSVDPTFMNEYTSTLFLPHTDIDLFPSVKKILKR